MPCADAGVDAGAGRRLSGAPAGIGRARPRRPPARRPRARTLPADGRFDHLLVDEFQDINAVQRALVRHWSAAGESLFVIGDPDQSIYGFRGADANCFERLRADLPELETVPLTVNYRSAPDILRRAADVHRPQSRPGARPAPRRQGGRARAPRARGYGFFRGGVDRQGGRPPGRRRGYARRLRDGGGDARLFRDGRARPHPSPARPHRGMPRPRRHPLSGGRPRGLSGRGQRARRAGVFPLPRRARGHGQPARRPAPQLGPWRRRPAPRRRLCNALGARRSAARRAGRGGIRPRRGVARPEALQRKSPSACFGAGSPCAALPRPWSALPAPRPSTRR